MKTRKTERGQPRHVLGVDRLGHVNGDHVSETVDRVEGCDSPGTTLRAVHSLIQPPLD